MSSCLHIPTPVVYVSVVYVSMGVPLTHRYEMPNSMLCRCMSTSVFNPLLHSVFSAGTFMSTWNEA